MKLRSQIAEELRTVLKDFVLKKPLSDKSNEFEPSSITVFEQNIPSPKMNEKPYHPFVCVRTENGKIDDYEQTESIAIIVSTWDDHTPELGEDDVINVIHRIINHFLANPMLDNRYYCRRDIEWAVSDERMPYFDGGITMTWEVPTMNEVQTEL